MNKLKWSVPLMIAIGLLGACTTGKKTGDQRKTQEKISIVTTFYPVYEFTKQVVGDEAKVELMIPAGTEPHDYEPSAKEMANVHDADVFVYHNENMETWVPKAKKSWKDGEPKIVTGTNNMVLLPGDHQEHDHDHGEEGHHHELDPHTWLSPNMAIKEVQSIKEQLVAFYPKKAEIFEKNTEKYVNQLKQLDEEYSASFRQAKQKSFITQHSAFGYLAVDYGLNQVPIAGLNPEEEPSSARLAELKEYVKKNGITYIYFEKNANDKIAQTLASEAKIQLEVLNPLESLTKEQLDNGENYLSVMKENLKALEKTTTVAGKVIAPEHETDSSKTVANGYFEDKAVNDRNLSDYEGNWQSVYPLLVDGTLDPIFEYKAKLKKDKTKEEYKNYYEKGYKTDVEKIVIKDDSIDFLVNGTHNKFQYKAVGHQILTYDKGNRGVRFLYETDDPKADRFKYVQFSDHNISPVKAAHFHIFFGGESQAKLFKEMDNWPTFYPKEQTKHEIAQEMMAH